MTGYRILLTLPALLLLAVLCSCSDDHQQATTANDLTDPMARMLPRGDRDASTPFLHLFLTRNGLTVPMMAADTVGYGHPFTLSWEGHGTATGLGPTAILAEADTVAPLDGLLGFQWGWPTGDDTEWYPRYYGEATGDSIPYFAPIESVTFANDGSSAAPTGRRLSAGIFVTAAKTVDLAGVEVTESRQLVHNHDPDSYLLNGEPDPIAEHDDPMTYPYYVVWHGPEAGIYSFSSGDTVPDGAYVVFKALGWDDRRDQLESAENQTTFQGCFEATGRYYDGPLFSFASTFSTPLQTPEWTAADAHGISADTLGFEVGPFAYDVTMRTVDEHLTHDGTAPALSFQGNFPPCVQCVELGGPGLVPADYSDMTADDCWDGECLDSERVVDVYIESDPRYEMISADQLMFQETSMLYVNPTYGQVRRTEIVGDGWYGIQTFRYVMLVYLHGRDHVREHWAPGFELNRIKSWRYQVDYQADEYGMIIDGPGLDDLDHTLQFNVMGNDPDPLLSEVFIDEQGVWGMQVLVDVPTFLMFGGEELFWSMLQTWFGCPPFPEGGDEEEILAWQSTPSVFMARRAWDLTRMQLTPGTVQVVARDQASCCMNSQVGGYHVYDGTRMPTHHGRSCESGAYDEHLIDGIVELATIQLEPFAAESNGGEATSKPFRIRAYQLGQDEPLDGSTAPPGWIEN